MKRRLLLVDDEPSIVATLKSILEIYGYAVETAFSAAGAIAMLRAARYDLVITDLRMEHDRSGFDVLEFARSTDYQPAVAILTAFPLLAQEWKPMGAQSLLLKPMRAAQLIRQIESILAAHEQEKQARAPVPGG